MWLFVKYWLPVLAWMGLIFGGSADASSGTHSSRIIGPFVRWFFPGISDDALETVVLVVRKCAHLTEYALLAMLLWRAFARPRKDGTLPRRWPTAGLAVLVAALYAASDEFHQTFVPTRTGSVWDVLLDACGAALGLAALFGLRALLAAGFPPRNRNAHPRAPHRDGVRLGRAADMNVAPVLNEGKAPTSVKPGKTG